jgi:hypothetical protein
VGTPTYSDIRYYSLRYRYPLLPRLHHAMVEDDAVPPSVHQSTRGKFSEVQYGVVSDCHLSPSAVNSSCRYVLFDNVFWLGTSGQINKWRKKHLGLKATDMGHMVQAKIPFLYNFSPVRRQLSSCVRLAYRRLSTVGCP